MNKQRRNLIGQAESKLSELEDLLSSIKEIIESARDEEQEYFDNMPESLQDADRGQTAQEAIDHLSEAYDSLEEISIDDLRDHLNIAAE